jgi:hypothetical protein
MSVEPTTVAAQSGLSPAAQPQRSLALAPASSRRRVISRSAAPAAVGGGAKR